MAVLEGECMTDQSEAPPRRGAAHRIVVILLACDVVIGATIAAVGYALLENRAIALGGAALALIGVALLVFFGLFGRRAE